MRFGTPPPRTFSVIMGIFSPSELTGNKMIWYYVNGSLFISYRDTFSWYHPLFNCFQIRTCERMLWATAPPDWLGLDALSSSDGHMISRITCLVYWQIARNTCSLIVQDAHVVRVFCETLTIYALK